MNESLPRQIQLLEQPNPSAPSHQPRAICRKFVYAGNCKEAYCPRAHVPHNDMLDLLHYLTQRDDFPPELRSARENLKSQKLNVHRKPLPSDRICRYFLPRPCLYGERCHRTHFRVGDIYRSLLWVNRSQPHEATTGQIGFEVPLETPVDPTARAIVPMPPNDEQLVVKSPQSAGSTHPQPVPFDHDLPPDVPVLLPRVSPLDSETIPTESVDSEHRQSSPAGPSLDTVAY